ncbi:MAG TPA: hypothetical protein VJJ98_04025 [Sedimentisphaerales bacterium]|nr:hypothetical protein [Sedimentisphaerales bacterium]
MSDKCPVCNSDVKEPHGYDDHGTSMFLFSCIRCGEYSTNTTFSRLLPEILKKDDRKIAVLSHWIRTKYEAEARTVRPHGAFKMVLLDNELVENILKQEPPKPAEQAKKFVRWVGDNIKWGKNYIPVRAGSIEAIIGSINRDEFYFVFGHLKEEGLIEHKTAVGGGDAVLMEVTLSFEGWEYYDELKRSVSDSRKAFMAMQFGDEQLDKIVEEVFKPAVNQTGFSLVRLDDIPEAGLLDDRLRVEIQTSRFLIADLTHENQGAYWEAGYAEGLGKPVVYTCNEAKFENLKTHFDTNHHLTITWDAEKKEEAAEKLKATIRATLPAEAKLTDS